MNALQIVALLDELLTLSTNVSAQIQKTSALLQKAHAEGRDITDAELADLRTQDDAAKKDLDDLIDANGTVTVKA